MRAVVPPQNAQDAYVPSVSDCRLRLMVCVYFQMEVLSAATACGEETLPFASTSQLEEWVMQAVIGK